MLQEQTCEDRGNPRWAGRGVQGLSPGNTGKPRCQHYLVHQVSEEPLQGHTCSPASPGDPACQGPGVAPSAWTLVGPG